MSQSSEFCRHSPLCCFSRSVYCCCYLFHYDPVRKLLDIASFVTGGGGRLSPPYTETGASSWYSDGSLHILPWFGRHKENFVFTTEAMTARTVQVMMSFPYVYWYNPLQLIGHTWKTHSIDYARSIGFSIRHNLKLGPTFALWSLNIVLILITRSLGRPELQIFLL
jgi:hypothetical protein